MGNTPSKIHDLVQIVSKTNLELGEEQIKLLRKFNRFNLVTRYPDYRFSFYRECTLEYTRINF